MIIRKGKLLTYGDVTKQECQSINHAKKISRKLQTEQQGVLGGFL